MFKPIVASIQFIVLQFFEMNILANVVVAGEIFPFGQSVTGSYDVEYGFRALHTHAAVVIIPVLQ